MCYSLVVHYHLHTVYFIEAELSLRKQVPLLRDKVLEGIVVSVLYTLCQLEAAVLMDDVEVVQRYTRSVTFHDNSESAAH